MAEYLAAIGSTGILRAVKDAPSKDEYFVFEDSQPQLKLKSVKFMKFASNRSSKEILCNQPVAQV
jgi:hypothetical protein